MLDLMDKRALVFFLVVAEAYICAGVGILDSLGDAFLLFGILLASTILAIMSRVGMLSEEGRDKDAD